MTTPTTKNPIDQEKLHRESMEIAPLATGIVPFLEEEIVNFETESASFQAGEQDSAQFTPFRLKQGGIRAAASRRTNDPGQNPRWNPYG